MNAPKNSDWERYVANQFDQQLDRFPKSIAFDDARVKAIEQAYSDWNGKLVLDLGCGSGRYWPILKKWGACVAGLDVSERSLEHAPADHLKLVGSVSRLQFPESSFDAVLLLELLQHLKDPEIAVFEALRLLKPSGRLIIIDRNPWALNSSRPWLPSLLMKQIDQRRGLWMYPRNSPVKERWSRPKHWQTTSYGYISNWNLQHLESTEESSRKIRRLVPLTRPFYCLTGTRSDNHFRASQSA